MRGEPEGDPALWIRPADELGKAIDEELRAAAYRNWKRVLCYAQSQGQDKSTAAEALELAVQSLAALTKRHPHARDRIKNLDYYIFWAAVRRLDKAESREPSIDYMGSTEDLRLLDGAQDTSWDARLEQEIVLKEITQFMNAQTRRLFSMRRAGYSWEEIARSLGTTTVNVESYFTKGVAKARRLILGRSRAKSGATPPPGRRE